MSDETTARQITDDVAFWTERVHGTLTWLMEGAPGVSQPQDVLHGICTRLTEEAGLPLFRVAVFVTTLHPSLLGRAFIWRQGVDEVEVLTASYDILDTDDYQRNPIPWVIYNKEPLRRRLCDPECPDDFDLLADLRAEGVTDYLIQPLTFTDGQAHAASWTTREPGGFTDGQVQALESIKAAFSRIAEIYGLKRLANNLLDAYLGPRTGARVLRGQIKLGDGEDIHAIIWFSDLRGSTTLADSMPRADFLAILNQFFDCLAGAVIDNGGEVLRFIGDSVLAIFPITDEGASAELACDTAVTAARDAAERMARLNGQRVAAGEDAIGFGIALHLGVVMYGNIGVPTRVEFSVIGAAANEAARLEGLCKTLGENLLVSADVAAHHPGPWRSLGSHTLRGVGDDHEVFTLDD